MIRFARLTAPAILLALAAANSSAQDYNFGPAKDSITRLSQFSGAIASSRTKVSGLFFGPRTVDVTCGYKCFIGICLYNQHFTYSLNMSGWRNSIEQVLSSQQQYSENFVNQFHSQFQVWAGTVVAVNADLQHVGDQIAQLQSDGPKLNPTLITLRRSAISASLTSVSRALATSSQKLQALTQQIAAYLQQQNRNQAQLTQLGNQLSNSFDQAFQKMKEFIDQQPCSGNAWDQYNDFKNGVNASVGTVNSTFASLRASASASDQAGSVLLGTLTNMSNRVNLVNTQLGQAQTWQTTNAALESLHIKVAAQAWQDFASYVSTQSKSAALQAPGNLSAAVR